MNDAAADPIIHVLKSLLLTSQESIKIINEFFDKEGECGYGHHNYQVFSKT